MARKESEFCRWETDFILDDLRFVDLTPEEKVIYQFAWAWAVRERTHFPSVMASPDRVAALCNVFPKVVLPALAKLSRKPHKLLSVRKNRDGSMSVKVFGVRDKHRRLLGWKD